MPLSTPAVVIYLYLLKLANDHNGYDVRVSDVVMGRTLGLTRKTVKFARELLQNSGLVQYEIKNGYCCSYRIVLNYPLQIPKQDKEQKVMLKHTPKISTAERNENLASVDLPVIGTPEIIEQKEETFISNDMVGSFKIDKKPSLEEFITYAHTLSGYEASMDSDIKEKYALWTGNDWCNNLGKPITDWKSSLRNLLPYMKDSTNNGRLSLKSIPTITPPKKKK